jgi:hypothetical protein
MIFTPPGEETKTKKIIDLSKPQYTLPVRIALPFSKFFRYFGIDVPALNFPFYEFNLNNRITKFYQVEVSNAFKFIKDKLAEMYKVPSVE